MLYNTITQVKIPWTFMGIGSCNKICEMVKAFEPVKILIVTDSGVIKAGIIDKIKAPLKQGGYEFDVFDGCQPEAPTTAIEELNVKVKTGNYNLLIGVGGGSALDTTKAASLSVGSGFSIYEILDGKNPDKTIRKLLVPTTAGTGSEWSISAVISDTRANNMTRLIKIPQNLADAAIVDPELTINLPQQITADTGMDALTHALEAYVSARANIISDMLAEKAIELISQNLRQAFAKGKKNIEARYNMAIASSVGMHATVIASTGLVHYMNEPLGKKARITHGKACAILLPHIMRFNLVANPEKFAKIASMMGENTSGFSVMDAALKSIDAVRKLSQDLEMPGKAGVYGIGEADVPAMAEEVVKKLGPVISETNPRDASKEDIARLFSLSI